MVIVDVDIFALNTVDAVSIVGKSVINKDNGTAIGNGDSITGIMNDYIGDGNVMLRIDLDSCIFVLSS